MNEKINRRAETHSLGPDGRRGRHSHPYLSRIARCRFRHARRLLRRGIISRSQHGYPIIETAFGIIPAGDLMNYTAREHEHIIDRLRIMASRAPLPPWRLSDCWQQAA